MPDNDVSLAIRWAEAGGDVPARATASMRALEAAANSAAPALSDRLGGAFASLERREPTMVMRRSALALEALSASAVGASGPLGRVGASFALLGGPEGIAALAAVAGAGEGLRLLTRDATETAEAVSKLTEKLGAVGPAATRALEQLRARGALTSLAGEGTLSRLAGQGLFSGFTGEGPMGLGTAALAMLGGTPRQDIEAITRIQAATGEAGLRTAMGRAGTEDHARAMREHADAMKRHAEQIKQDADRRAKIWESSAASRFRPLTNDRLFMTPLELGGEPHGITTTDFSSGGSAIAQLQAAAGNRYDPGPPDRQAAATGKSIAREIAPVLASSIAFLGAIARGGGPEAALGGLGGIATAASAIKGISGGAAEGLGIAGIALSTLSGLASVFGAGKPHIVTIGELQQRALDQLKDSVVIPAMQALVVVAPQTGDLLKTLNYQLGRVNRRDAGGLANWPVS
jgi:hypothetical protein